ncbi:KilA-N domain-containing protein [Pseudomonas moorei]|uniref:KilA-N domain-containing protein n=1 Tax=Pseudomonas moorei TaxID=395599 RepID=UPI00200CF451|nr:KilA-N domain-containing protein [Pseudomonas moorei]
MSTKSLAVSKPALITKDWQGKTFTFREDGYFNMTKAAKEFGKDLSHFKRSPDTIDYCNELSQTAKFADCLILDTRRGGTSPGTWGHPKLAVFFARWLDVRFSVACGMMIDDILKGVAVVTMEKPEESASVAYAQALAGALEQQSLISQNLLGLIAQQPKEMTSLGPPLEPPPGHSPILLLSPSL